MRKEKELTMYYFSVLKLGFKKAMIKQLKAEKHHNLVLKSKIFDSIKIVT